MNRFIGVIAIGIAAATVSACESDYGSHTPGYGPRYAEVAPAPIAYDGYYDGAYGAFYDGYWDNDGAFYYTDAADHPFRRDDGHHFRHDAAEGFHGVNGAGARHPGGGEHRPG